MEHPARIWDHAFRHQISEAARHLLLVLGTLPDEVLLNDLEIAFWAFYRLRQKKFGFSTTSGDWNNALKELDGSFVTTKRIGEDLFATFHNPSIRDYIEDFLSNSEGDVEDLICGSHFYEQYTRIWGGRHGQRYRGVDRHRELFLQEFHGHIFGPSASTIRHVNSDGLTIGLHHRTISNESRTRFLVQVVNEINGPEAHQLLNSIITQLEEQWNVGQADKEDLVLLLGDLTDRGLKTNDEPFQAAQQCISSKIEEIDDFRAIASFTEKYPNILTSTDMDLLRIKFGEFAEEYAEGWDDVDPDWLRQVAGDLEFIGEKLSVDVDHFRDSLCETADTMENRRSGRDYYYDEDDSGWRPSTDQSDNVDCMFQSLRAELDA